MVEKNKPTSTDKIYLEHARQADQLAEMQGIAERDICFMCPQHIEEFYEQRNGLIDEGEHSYLVHNGYPYENTEIHMMVLPKEHAVNLEGLSDDFLLEAFGFFRKIETELNVTGGAIALRFGNPAETGASAHHLHMHFIVPRSDLSPSDKPVRFRMSPRFPPEG